MKAFKIFLALFIFTLTVCTSFFAYYSVTKYIQVTNGFTGQLDQKGFWLNPLNKNISKLTEEDTYVGSLTFAAQDEAGNITLGIMNSNNAYRSFVLPKKIKPGSVYTLSKTDTPGNYKHQTVEDSFFYDFLKKKFVTQENSDVEICLSKSVTSAAYDYICGVAIYEK